MQGTFPENLSLTYLNKKDLVNFSELRENR